MRITLPQNIKNILSRLASAGFEGFVVGGCVRDALIGKLPGDWDVATSASPEETKAAMGELRTVDTGIKHGTVSVIIDGVMTEITTFRSDGVYSDSRHPDSVTFTRNIADDLSRRDFTVNAMAYSERTGLIDLFGGERDIGLRLIRCVGDPDTRFGEDALRIMRGVRFASVLGFSIEDATAQSILRGRGLLGGIAVERKRDELLKLLCGDGVGEVLESYYPVIAEVVPELRELESAADFECMESLCSVTARALTLAPRDTAARTALLMRGLYELDGAQKVFEILCRLRLSKAMRRDIITILSSPEAFADVERAKVLLGECGQGLFTLAARCVEAWEAARGCADSDEASAARHWRARAAELIRDGECLSLSGLALDGAALAAEGLPPGRRMGELLERLLGEVLRGEIPNEREALLSRAREMTD